MRIASALLGASALVALSAAPALAQSAFDGPYAGVAAGYTWLNPDARTTTPNNILNERVDESADGFTGAAFLGYGRTFDNFYLGGEVELGWSDLEETFRVGANPYGYEAGLTYGLSARAGVLADKDTLLYGRVGWQRTELDVTSQLNNVITIGGFIPAINESQDLDAWRVGGGVERVIGQNLLARAEYVYTNYEDLTLRYTGNVASQSLSPEEHTVRVGIAYRF